MPRGSLYFPHPFSDLAFGLKLCQNYLDYSVQTKNFFEYISKLHIVLFLFHSFGTETINKFIRSRSSPENHTRFQTKMCQVFTRFQTKEGPLLKFRQGSRINTNRAKGANFQGEGGGGIREMLPREISWILTSS